MRGKLFDLSWETFSPEWSQTLDVGSIEKKLHITKPGNSVLPSFALNNYLHNNYTLKAIYQYSTFRYNLWQNKDGIVMVEWQNININHLENIEMKLSW